MKKSSLEVQLPENWWNLSNWIQRKNFGQEFDCPIQKTWRVQYICMWNTSNLRKNCVLLDKQKGLGWLGELGKKPIQKPNFPQCFINDLFAFPWNCHHSCHTFAIRDKMLVKWMRKYYSNQKPVLIWINTQRKKFHI